MRKFRSYIFVMLAIILVACSSNDANQNNASQAENELSLIGDATLDQAKTLPINESLRTFSNLELPSAGLNINQRLLSRQSLEVRNMNGSLNPNANTFSNTGGYLAYVEQKNSNYSVVLNGLGNTGASGFNGTKTVYKGKRTIQSVSVSADGSFVAFIAETSSGNNDLYLVDVGGSRFGTPNSVIAINTPENEQDISMSMDGNVLSWQGGTDANPSLVYVVLEAGTIVDGLELNQANVGLVPVQPSLSGNGSTVTFIDLSGAVALAPVLFTINFNTFAVDAWYAGDLSNPSLDYSGNLILFEEVFAGVNYLSLLDTIALNLNDIIAGPDVDHPYLTADGEYLTFSFSGTPYLGTVDGNLEAQKINNKATASATYWAKGSFGQSSGDLNTSDPIFTRPDDGSGLNATNRTVHYDAFSYRAPKTDLYEILSNQDFDGYILLYKGSFDPNNPEKNLIASNDDSNGGYDPDGTPQGQSSIVAELKKNKTYIIVTTACGALGSSCGPDLGNYETIISDGAEPPLPPISLPAPDPTRYNITVIFEPETDATLTDAQKQVFLDAAERWSSIITADIADIGPTTFTANTFFPNTPAITGTVDDLLLLVRFGALGGPLGRAGPRFVRVEGQANEFLSIAGIMEFEIAEFAPGGFFNDQQQYEDVIVHEMGHVIGIGTLWDLTNNVDENYIASNPPTVPAGLPNPDYNPGFTGEGAVAEYSTLTGATETVTPIANTGGPGNYNGHWREIVFNNELMTPYAGGAELLSRITAASLGDIGYDVDINSLAVDQDYELTREIGMLSQISPTPTTYTEFDDFLIFNGSAEGNVTGTVEAVDINLTPPRASTSGCEASDFASFTPGNIALLQRGTCPFVDKVANAETAGATAVVMFNQGDSTDEARTGIFSGSSNSGIPAVGITYALGESFAGIDGLVLNISVSSESGPLTTAALKPHFEEELLRPIGTVDSNGTIIINSKTTN